MPRRIRIAAEKSAYLPWTRSSQRDDRVSFLAAGDLLRDAVLRALRQRPVISATFVAATLFAHSTPAFGTPFPAEFELSSLLPGNGGNGVSGFVLNGIDIRDNSGLSVGAAGDVNGDGIGDLIVGADFSDPNGVDSAGESYVVFGRDTAQIGNFPAEFELASLAAGNGSAGFVLNGIDAGDISGRSVSAAGDVNGDGIGDLIVGALFAAPNGTGDAGESYVVFGRDTTQVGNFPAEFALASLAAGDGSTGFVLNGVDIRDRSGLSVGAAGDVNGDGIGDLIVGALFAAPNGTYNAGESYVVFGRDTTQIGNFPAEFELASLAAGNGSAGFVLNGIDARDYSGRSVSSAGDVNGDGIRDLIVGAYFADPNGVDSAGESYVVFGRDTAQVGNFPSAFELSSLAIGDGSEGFVLNGIDFGDRSGLSVSAAGDVNGDGIGDLIVGAMLADPNGVDSAGESYVVFGRDTAQNGNFPAEFELASLAAGNGSAGFVLNGIVSGDFSGRSASAAGDVNGDGIGDLIVGALFAAPNGVDSAGESYVVFGRDTAQIGNFPAEFELASLAAGDGGAGFVLNGIDDSDHSGESVGAAGDVNGDGIGDLIVGAHNASANGVDYAGESYVVFGRSDSSDLDHDGVPDIGDNCFAIQNADQRDTNSDGFGNVCDADLDNDCFVNFVDLGILKSVFLTAADDADLDGDGVVDLADLGIMKARFFARPGPSRVPNNCD